MDEPRVIAGGGLLHRRLFLAGGAGVGLALLRAVPAARSRRRTCRRG